MFFAVGLSDEDKTLFIVDDYPRLIPQTVIDTIGISEDIKGYQALVGKGRRAVEGKIACSNTYLDGAMIAHERKYIW